MEKVLSANVEVEQSVKANKVLQINLTHKLFEKLKSFDKDSNEFKKLCNVLYTQALMLVGLSFENVTQTIDDIFDLIAE